MWGNYYGHMGGFGFGFIFMLIFWVLLIITVSALIRGLSGRGCWHDLNGHKSGENSALKIIKERYAKGEISKEEFEKMKKDLE